jgi:hypothetical protein
MEEGWEPEQNDGGGMDVVQPSGGLLGRWENVVHKHSCKRMVACEASTAEFQRRDYLKPQHMPASHVDGMANYAPVPDINQTRFHRGFQRRHQADIQQDAPRLEYETYKEAVRDFKADQQVLHAKGMQSKSTFNIITGEGNGRDCEFRQLGKKIVNPFGSMNAVYAEHDKDLNNRVRNSKFRFFDYPPTSTSDPRMQTLFNEGLTETKRQTMVIGYGLGNPRSKNESLGVADNYTHLKATRPEPEWEKPRHGNHSQIVFG